MILPNSGGTIRSLWLTFPVRFTAMLSYRHAYHAGNHADVLKHLTQMLILEYMLQKADKPLCYIDTHAGPGSYSLRGGYADKCREFEQGIGRIYSRDDLAEPIARYRDRVCEFNRGGNLLRYPGSPAIALELAGTTNRLRLFELHPADFHSLDKWATRQRRVEVEQADGFERVLKSLPPPERRALVVIDPPYEIKRDYRTVLVTLDRCVKLFATGVYLLWYPLLERSEVIELRQALRAKPWRWLNAELRVRDRGEGMFGSGVFVINPPWHLAAELNQCLPQLQQILALDAGADSELLTHGLE